MFSTSMFSVRICSFGSDNVKVGGELACATDESNTAQIKSRHSSFLSLKQVVTVVVPPLINIRYHYAVARYSVSLSNRMSVV